MAYENEWRNHGKDGRGKRYVDAPYDAIIEPIDDGSHRGCWRCTVRLHHEDGRVETVYVSRAFRMLRLAKSSAISTIMERKLNRPDADRTSSLPPDPPRVSRASS